MNQAPVIFQGEKVKLLEEHFQGGTVTGGYANGNLNRLKIRLVQIAIRACQIGDMVRHKMTDTDLRSMLYETLPEPSQEEIVNSDLLISEVVEKTPWLFLKHLQSKLPTIQSGELTAAKFTEDILVGNGIVNRK